MASIAKGFIVANKRIALGIREHCATEHNDLLFPEDFRFLFEAHPTVYL